MEAYWNLTWNTCVWHMKYFLTFFNISPSVSHHVFSKKSDHKESFHSSGAEEVQKKQGKQSKHEGQKNAQWASWEMVYGLAMHN